jgi:hypothetical protein
VKKYLAIVLGMLLILSFAVTAFAMDKPEITLGGNIMVRGWYFDNIGSVMFEEGTLNNLPVKRESQAHYTTDATISIDAKVSDNVRGLMELETTTDRDPNTGEYIWGTYDTKPAADLFFRQLWIQYTGSGLLGVPTGIKAGHQLLTLGEKQFLNHERFGDDAILLTVEPTKELLIGLLTVKLNEGQTTIHRDDIDAYVLLGTYKIDKDNTVGLNYTLLHSDAAAEDTFPYDPTVDSLDLQNLGLHANGKVSGLSYAAEVDFQFGKAKMLPGEGDDAKFKGYGIFAKLGYKVDPVNLRASFAMGSGDNDQDDNDIKEFQTLVGNDDQSATARFVHFTQLYERAIKTAANPEGQITGNQRTTGIANTTYYNLGLDVTPVSDLNLSLDGYIIRATKEWYNGQSKNVGTEVDLTASYKIAKNLTYFVQAGIFSPGKFYEFINDASSEKRKTATMAVHGLSLTF